jgi:hypothetical protein
MPLLPGLKYVVEENDDYNTIALDTGTSANDLYDINQGADLNAGQTINLPPSDPTQFQSGHLASDGFEPPPPIDPQLVGVGAAYNPGDFTFNPNLYQSGALPSSIIPEAQDLISASGPGGFAGQIAAGLDAGISQSTYQSGHLRSLSEAPFVNFDYSNFPGTLPNLPTPESTVIGDVSNAILGGAQWATWENVGIAVENAKNYISFVAGGTGDPNLVPFVPPTDEETPEFDPSPLQADPENAFIWSNPENRAAIELMGQTWRATHPDETTPPPYLHLVIANQVVGEIAAAETADELPTYLSDHIVEIFYKTYVDKNGDQMFESIEDFYNSFGYKEYADGYVQRTPESVKVVSGGYGKARGYGYGYPSSTRGQGYQNSRSFTPGLVNWRIGFE